MLSEERKKILLDIANALEANEKLIKIENEADVAAAVQAGYDKSMVSRLTLKPGKARNLKSYSLCISLTLYIIYTPDSVLSDLVALVFPISDIGCTRLCVISDFKPCQLNSRACQHGRPNRSSSKEN